MAASLPSARPGCLPLGEAGTVYAVLPARNDCPRCFRTMVLYWPTGGGDIDCSGCGALFRYEAATDEQPEGLRQVEPPAKVKRTTPPERRCSTCGSYFAAWGSQCSLCDLAERHQAENGPFGPGFAR